MLYNNITITINTEIGVLDYTISRDIKSKLFILGYDKTISYLKQHSNRIIDDTQETVTSNILSDINKEIIINNDDKLNNSNIENEFIIDNIINYKELDLENPIMLDPDNITMPVMIDITTIRL